MAKNFWCRAVPLSFAALLLLSGCDDEEKKDPEVEIHVPKGVEIKVKRIEDDEMVIAAELLATTGIVLWALFGPGARRRWPAPDAGPVDKRPSDARLTAKGALSENG